MALFQRGGSAAGTKLTGSPTTCGRESTATDNHVRGERQHQLSTNVCYWWCAEFSGGLLAHREAGRPPYRAVWSISSPDRAEHLSDGSPRSFIRAGIDPQMPVTLNAGPGCAAGSAAGALGALPPTLRWRRVPALPGRGRVESGLSDPAARGRWTHALQTAAEILDDDVRLGADKGQAARRHLGLGQSARPTSGDPLQLDDEYGHVDHTRQCSALPLSGPCSGPDRRVQPSCLALHVQPTPTRRSFLPLGNRRGRRELGETDRVVSRDGPASPAAVRIDNIQCSLEALRRRHQGDARRRVQRPGRHPDGGDHARGWRGSEATLRAYVAELE